VNRSGTDQIPRSIALEGYALAVLDDRKFPSDRAPNVSEISRREAVKAIEFLSTDFVSFELESVRTAHVIASTGAIRIPTRQFYWIEIDRSGEVSILEPESVSARFGGNRHE